MRNSAGKPVTELRLSLPPVRGRWTGRRLALTSAGCAGPGCRRTGPVHLASPRSHDKGHVVDLVFLYPVDDDGMYLGRGTGQVEAGNLFVVDHVLSDDHPAENVYFQLWTVAEQLTVLLVHDIQPIHQDVPREVPDDDAGRVIPEELFQVTVPV